MGEFQALTLTHHMVSMICDSTLNVILIVGNHKWETPRSLLQAKQFGLYV